MRNPDSSLPPEPTDDVDRLFARLERATVPNDLTARVLSNTVARGDAARRVLAWPWTLAAAAALAMLTITGYELGASFAANSGLELLTAILSDAGLLATDPGDVLAAVGEIIPWSLLALAGVSAALLTLAAGNLVSRGPASVKTRTLV
jgi:hypothetical protein